MFTEAAFGHSQGESNFRDDDGAKRVFFGGERFIEGVSGEAFVINAVPTIFLCIKDIGLFLACTWSFYVDLCLLELSLNILALGISLLAQ